MVKNDVMNVIRKRLNAVKKRKDDKSREELKNTFKAEVKENKGFSKKRQKLNEKIRSLQDDLNILSKEFAVFDSKLRKKSNGAFSFGGMGYDTPSFALGKVGVRFDVNAEFDKIEEELILSEDESGTLKAILERIAEM